MGSRILNVTFACSDPGTVAAFWSEVLGWTAEYDDMPGNPFWVVAETSASSPRLVFVLDPGASGLTNRVHLDLVPRDATLAEEVARLELLGARVVDDRRDADPGGWVVMADPEGHALCVERGGDE